MAANGERSQYEPLADLGGEIRQLRKLRGITLQQLALATGKSVGFLSQVERNRSRPSVAALQDISEALGISRYEPGASTGDDEYTHDGEEAGLILSGSLELTLDGRLHRLEAGDSFSFKSQLPQRYANPSASEELVVVWANTPITLRK